MRNAISLVRELNDDVIAKFGSALCPDLLEGYEFGNNGSQGTLAPKIVVNRYLSHSPRIMERECGVHVCW